MCIMEGREILGGFNWWESEEEGWDGMVMVLITHGKSLGREMGKVPICKMPDSVLFFFYSFPPTSSLDRRCTPMFSSLSDSADTQQA